MPAYTHAMKHFPSGLLIALPILMACSAPPAGAALDAGGFDASHDASTRDASAPDDGGSSPVDAATPPDTGPGCPGGCDDGDPCTEDLCTAGACAHPARGDGTLCGPATACTEARCAAGRCAAAPVREGSPCPDDGESCTDDRCRAGACVHSPRSDGATCSLSTGASSRCSTGRCDRPRAYAARVSGEVSITYYEASFDGRPVDQVLVCDATILRVLSLQGGTRRETTMSCPHGCEESDATVGAQQVHVWSCN